MTNIAVIQHKHVLFNIMVYVIANKPGIVKVMPFDQVSHIFLTTEIKCH